jgi:hypothetical protein
MAKSKAMASLDEGSEPRGVRGAVYSLLGYLLQKCIEWLVRLTGRRVLKTDAPWLDCVIGRPDVILRNLRRN